MPYQSSMRLVDLGVTITPGGHSRAMTMDDLMALRSIGSPIDGHQSNAWVSAFSTPRLAPFGQGLSVSAGLAAAAQQLIRSRASGAQDFALLRHRLDMRRRAGIVLVGLMVASDSSSGSIRVTKWSFAYLHSVLSAK
jgi:hypothetical protein